MCDFVSCCFFSQNTPHQRVSNEAHGPVPVFVHKVLLSRCHPLLFLCCRWLLSSHNGKAELPWQRLHGLQRLKYLLSGSIRISLPTSVLERKPSSVLLLSFLNHDFYWLQNIPLTQIIAIYWHMALGEVFWSIRSPAGNIFMLEALYVARILSLGWIPRKEIID